MYRGRSAEKSPSLPPKRPKQLVGQYHSRDTHASPSQKKSTSPFTSPAPQPPFSSLSSSSSSSLLSKSLAATDGTRFQVSLVDEEDAESVLKSKHRVGRKKVNVIPLRVLLNGSRDRPRKNQDMVKPRSYNVATSSFKNDVISSVVVDIHANIHRNSQNAISFSQMPSGPNEKKSIDAPVAPVDKSSSISSSHIGAFEEGVTAKEFEVQLQESSSDEDSDENDDDDDDDDEHRKEKVKPKAIENEDQRHISIDINKHIPAKDNVNSYNQIVRGTTSISPSRAAQAFKASSRVIQDDDDGNEKGKTMLNGYHYDNSKEIIQSTGSRANGETHNDGGAIFEDYPYLNDDNNVRNNPNNNNDDNAWQGGLADTPVNSQNSQNVQIEPELQDGEWRCSRCTFINKDEKSNFCCVCTNKRIITRAKRLLPKSSGKENMNAFFGGGGVGSSSSSFEIKDKTNGTVHTRKKSKRLEDLSIPQLTKLPIVAEKPLPQDKNITGSTRYATKIFEAGGGEISMVEPPKSYHHDNYEYNNDHEDFQAPFSSGDHESLKHETEKYDFTRDVIGQNGDSVKKDVSFKLQFATDSCSYGYGRRRQDMNVADKDSNGNYNVVGNDDDDDDDDNEFVHVVSRRKNVSDVEDVTRGVFKHFKSISEVKRTGDCHINFKDFVLQTCVSKKTPIDLRQDKRREQREKAQQKKKKAAAKTRKSGGKKSSSWGKKFYRRKSK